MHADDDDLEPWVNDALATYAKPDASPAPRLVGMRVLAAARKQRLARRWWACAGLVSASACLLLLIFVARIQRRVAPVPTESAAMQEATLPKTSVPRTALVARPQVISMRRYKQPAVEAKAAGLARLDRFPAPVPLTDEEKLMLAFVGTASPATQQFVARAVEPPLSIRIAEGQPLSDNTGAVETPAPETSKAGALHEEHR